MTRKPALACIALLCSTAAGAQMPLSTQDMFVDRLFAESGFPPLVTASNAPTDVRDLLVRDPYGGLPIPGLSVERFADGRTELRLRYWGWGEGPISLDDNQWQRIVDADRSDRARAAAREAERRATLARLAANQPPARADGTVSPPPPPPPVCHAWSARLRDGAGTRSSWSGCGNEPVPEMVTVMIAIAMAPRPDCEVRDGDPFWSFQRCFQPRDFDNAELGLALGELREDETTRPVAMPLAEARAALIRPDLAPGSPDWIAARDKIEELRALLADKRAKLHRIGRFDRFAMSDADRARSDFEIRNRREFLDGQDRNLIELLTQLANGGRR